MKLIPLKEGWLKQKYAFDQVWENRYQPPTIMESWVENEWAKGRTEYLTFLIRITDTNIIDSIKGIQTEIKNYRCVETFPANYLHITVKELDAFLVSKKQLPDEYSNEELSKLIKDAEEILNSFKKFDITIENLNNFKSTVCIQVHDGGVISDINGAFLQIPGVRKLRNDYPKFLPHLSIAQYKNFEGYEPLISYLEQNRYTSVGSLKVDAISFVVAKLPVKGRYPKLKVIKNFELTN